MSRRAQKQPESVPEVPPILRDFVLNNTQDPMLVAVGTTIVEANDALVRLFGYGSRDEMIGLSFSAITSPESFGIAQDRVAKRMAGKWPTTSHLYTAVRRNGEKLLVEGSVISWPDDPAITIAIVRDVTEREKRVDALKESEELYRALAETIPAGVLMEDASGRVFYANEQMAALTGHSVEELKRGVSLLDPKNRSARAEYWKALKEGTSGNDFRAQIIRKDGGRIWVSVSWRPIRTRRGSHQGIVTTFVDVTERRRTEAALRESEERFRSLVGNLPGAVMRLVREEDWTFDFVSDAVESITGYPAGHFVGHAASTLVELIHPEDRDRVRDSVMADLEERRPILVEYRLVNRDGSTRVCSGRGQGVYDRTGLLRCVDTVVFDITALHEAQQALRETEERYRLLAENASDIIWQMDTAGLFTYVSQAVRQYGYEAEEWIGHDLLGFLPPEEQGIYLERFRRDRASPSPKRYEVQMLRKDGARVWMDVQVNVVSERDAVFIQGIARDITDRKRAEEALRESEEKYRSIVENTRDLIMLAAPGGRIVYLSPAVKDMLGYTPEELPQLAPEVIYPDDRKAVAEAIREGFSGSSRSDFEYRFITKSGDTLWVSHSWSPIMREGKVQTVVSVIRDITERRIAEDQLREAHADLEKAYQIQREFLNSVTHEIRTPMTAVKGYVEMLLEGMAGPLNESQEAMLRKVLAGSDNLLELVTSLLEVARLKTGRATLRPKACKPGAIAEKAISAVMPQAAQKGVPIELWVVGRDRMGVYDEEKVVIILNNLLSNAVKFTSRGRVEVQVRSTPSGAEIIVTDTGMGIPQKDLATIFEQFQQLEHPKRHKPAGFGLGLAIVANMVIVLGATLVVSSRVGVGTAFTLSIPKIEAGN